MQDHDRGVNLTDADGVGGDKDPGHTPPIPGGPALELPPPPRRGWFTFRRTFDPILSDYLQRSLQTVRKAFDDYRDSFSDLPGRVDLMKIDERLGLCLDLLQTSPTLSPSRSEFRPDRQKVIGLLERLRQATDDLGNFAGAADELRSRDPGSPEWEQVCERLIEIMARLETSLRHRRELR